jgi:integrase
MALTDTKIRNAKALERPYKLMDSLGLYLLVRINGTKLWRFRFWLHGKEGLMALGEYPSVGLADARALRDRARALVKQGLNPVRERQTDRIRQAHEATNTFEGIAREWIESSTKRWSKVRLDRVTRVLEKEAFPEFGHFPVREITAAHVLRLLQDIEKRPAPVTALLVQQLVGAVFRHAVRTLRADYDPAGALRGVIQRPRTKHKTPLTAAQIPTLLDKLNNYGGDPQTVAAIRLLLLLFVRPGELRLAHWSEFDLDNAEWRIPAARMKMRETHVIPLSSQAIEVLRGLHEITGANGLLFPNRRNSRASIASTTLNRALENLGFKGLFSAHGFRATASTMLNELGWRSDVIERQLAHAERDKTRASYDQSKHMPERRKMMQAWADYLDALRDERKVVAGNFGKAA